MKIKNIIDNLIEIDNDIKNELQKAHPKQWLNEVIKIPIWKIKYEYTTVRNNHKIYYKYFIADETDWDLIEPEFNFQLKCFNENNPERKLSNVQILDIKFLGDFSLPIE